MKSLDFSRYALCSCVAAAMLTGCSGSQPPIGAPGAMPQGRPITTHAERGGSRVLPDAKGDLLYVSSPFDGSVLVFTYPSLKRVAIIPSLNHQAFGACSDQRGNVFVTTADAQGVGTIFEFAHGGTQPVATLSDPGLAYGCAFDPKTNNLAVSNLHDPSYGGNGDLAVYENAQGAPTLYSSPNIGFLYSCGYDGSSDLYADGGTTTSYGTFLFELPQGGSSLSQIAIDTTIKAPGSVQWDGQSITIANNSASTGGHRHGPETIYRLQISNGVANVVGTTTLMSRNNRHSGQTWIQGKRALAIVGTGRAGFAMWAYPKGAKPLKQVANAHNNMLFGVTVSLAHGH